MIKPYDLFSTYSIVAFDPDTKQIGGAVQTHQMAVGRIIPFALPGVGVVASQSLANISYGPVALRMLLEGIPPSKIVAGLRASDVMANRRQVAVINAKGEVAAFTGDACIAHAAHHVGEHYSVQANMMTNETVIAAMATAYEQATGDLAARMLAALRAAQAEDGDIRGSQSAALKIVSGDRTDREWATVYDLRVDEHERPVEELTRLVRLRSAQIMDNEGYIALAEDKREEALARWAAARATAPELEELAFWQAVTLADGHDELGLAVTIFQEAFADDPRRTHWLDLIRRLAACGLITKPQVAEDLLKLLE